MKRIIDQHAGARNTVVYLVEYQGAYGIQVQTEAHGRATSGTYERVGALDQARVRYESYKGMVSS